MHRVRRHLRAEMRRLHGLTVGDRERWRPGLSFGLRGRGLRNVLVQAKIAAPAEAGAGVTVVAAGAASSLAALLAGDVLTALAAWVAAAEIPEALRPRV